MRSLLLFVAGLLLGGVVTLLVVTAADGAYSQRMIRDSTTGDEITRWIERDNCRPMTINDRAIYYRCPRFRL